MVEARQHSWASGEPFRTVGLRSVAGHGIVQDLRIGASSLEPKETKARHDDQPGPDRPTLKETLKISRGAGKLASLLI